jgi:hypothetical protein
VVVLQAGFADSLVAQTAESFVQALTVRASGQKINITTLDLWSPGLLEGNNYGSSHVSAKMRLLNGEGNSDDIQTLSGVERMAAELVEADILVVRKHAKILPLVS